MEENLPLNDKRMFWFITFWAVFSASIPTLIKIVLWLFFRESELEGNLRKQITELKTELGTINMTQEFVKYAKIQRKINKMMEELKNQGNLKTMLKLKTQIIVYAAAYILVTFFSIYLLWSNRYKPLLILDTNLPYPIGNLIAFPTGVKGAIGVTCWFSMVTFSCRHIRKVFSSYGH